MHPDDIWDITKDVHARLLSNFTYVSDKKQHGVIEDWRLPRNFDRFRGDCDDFALACRTLCMQEGLETRLVLCTTETNETHLVCAVGNYILDNRMDTVHTKRYMERQGYKWIAVSGKVPGSLWHILNEGK